MNARRWILAILLIECLAVSWLGRPPQPSPLDAPPGRFSALRAIAAISDLPGADVPRPPGSVANGEFRAELAQRLEAMGAVIEGRLELSCARRCAPVHNLIATFPGSEPALAVMAHFDSTPVGPGAADDLSGIATAVEIARATRAEALSHRLVLILTDGEELGLLGAHAAFAEQGAADGVAVVLNLEARGGRGRSAMFEVLEPAWPLLSAYRASVSRPATTSVGAAIYRSMPNGTDLSVARVAGLSGAGFAFFDGVELYHSRRDDFAHLDPASVEHHGRTSLELLRELDRRLDEDPELFEVAASATFFDLAGRMTVAWPSPWGWLLVVLGWLCLAGAWWRRSSRGGWGRSQAIVGVFTAPAMVAAAVATAWGLAVLLDTGAPFPPGMGYRAAGCWLAVSLPVMVIARLSRSLVGPWGGVLAAAAWLLGIGTYAQLIDPQIAYPFLLPGLAIAMLASLLADREDSCLVVGVAVLLSAVLVSPILQTIASALGQDSLVPGAVLVGFVLLPMVGVEGSFKTELGLMVPVVVLLILAVGANWSEEVPRSLRLAAAIGGDEPGRLYMDGDGQLPASLEHPELVETRHGSWRRPLPADLESEMQRRAGWPIVGFESDEDGRWLRLLPDLPGDDLYVLVEGVSIAEVRSSAGQQVLDGPRRRLELMAVDEQGIDVRLIETDDDGPRRATVVTRRNELDDLQARFEDLRGELAEPRHRPDQLRWLVELELDTYWLAQPEAEVVEEADPALSP